MKYFLILPALFFSTESAFATCSFWNVKVQDMKTAEVKTYGANELKETKIPLKKLKSTDCSLKIKAAEPGKSAVLTCWTDLNKKDALSVTTAATCVDDIKGRGSLVIMYGKNGTPETYMIEFTSE